MVQPILYNCVQSMHFFSWEVSLFTNQSSFVQDALLASIAETEKQTEMAARVSRWKQNIEHNLEEQVKS